MEEWRGIEGFPLYAISDEGRVKNVVTDHILKPGMTNSGYYQVHLMREGVRYPRYVHRLVALNFLNSMNSDLEVNHIDGNKTNNTLQNLMSCTSRENKLHAFEIGLSTPKRKMIRIVETGQTFLGLTACGDFLNRTKHAVSKALKTGYLVNGYHVEAIEEA